MRERILSNDHRLNAIKEIVRLDPQKQDTRLSRNRDADLGIHREISAAKPVGFGLEYASRIEQLSPQLARQEPEMLDVLFDQFFQVCRAGLGEQLSAATFL